MKSVVVTGGGTAGHVVPAIPVIEQLREMGVQVLFIGTRSGLEARLIEPLEIAYAGIAAGKLRRYLSWRNVADAFRVVAGFFQALMILLRTRPDVVFSKGGFVSAPVVLAAWFLRIPVVAHESDVTPGLANRLALPFVKTVCVNFPVDVLQRAAPEAWKRFRGVAVHTGTPVRKALLDGDADKGRRWLGVSGAKPLLVVTGGSLGAEAINNLVLESLDELCARFDVVHVCGPGRLPAISHSGYHPYEFLSDTWGDVLAAADLVVSRAGANTLYELIVLRKVHVLIPLTRLASRGDQLENAAMAEAEGYSVVLSETEATPARLLEVLAGVQAGQARISAHLAGFSVPDSTQAIVATLKAAAGSTPDA